MKLSAMLGVLFILGAGLAFAGPTVDGKVANGEYDHTQKLIRGAGTLSWTGDGQGGLYLAFAAQGKGWAGVGLGASRMSGAYIYLGFVGADGKAVFSEQSGRGHTHRDSGKVTADQSVVTLAGGVTTLEFHVAGDKLPFTGKTVPFIVAFSNSADLVSFHEQSYDSGTFTLP